MGRAWIKLYTEMLSDHNVSRLSHNATALLPYLFLQAGVCDDDGWLRVRSGPLTSDELAQTVKLDSKDAKDALAELVRSGFLEAKYGGYRVANWAKFNPPIDATAPERQRRYRENHRPVTALNTGVSNGVVDGTASRVDNATDKKRREEDKNMATVTVADIPRFPGKSDMIFPSDVAGMRTWADYFLAAFANCKTDEAKAKHRSTYVETLSIFRGRKLSPAIAWECFGQAWVNLNGKPLFGASAKKALAFIGAPKDAPLPEYRRHRVNTPPRFTR